MNYAEAWAAADAEMAHFLEVILPARVRAVEDEINASGVLPAGYEVRFGMGRESEHAHRAELAVFVPVRSELEAERQALGDADPALPPSVDGDPTGSARR